MVEFALVLPVFMTLILGMFSGGLAYNRDNSLAHAAREAARYGATLPKGTSGPNWTAAISARAEEAAAGDLDAITTPQPGHYICVALIKDDGTVQAGYTSAATAPNIPVGTPAECYADGLVTGSGLRVHVMIGRPGKIQLLVQTIDVKLGGKATARFEDPTP